jgi:hypothetical protein
MKIRAGAALLLLSLSLAATQPNDATRRWWQYISALANNGMEGRDTGSPPMSAPHITSQRNLKSPASSLPATKATSSPSPCGECN